MGTLQYFSEEKLARELTFIKPHMKLPVSNIWYKNIVYTLRGHFYSLLSIQQRTHNSQIRIVIPTITGLLLAVGFVLLLNRLSLDKNLAYTLVAWGGDIFLVCVVVDVWRITRISPLEAGTEIA